MRAVTTRTHLPVRPVATLSLSGLAWSSLEQGGSHESPPVVDAACCRAAFGVRTPIHGSRDEGGHHALGIGHDVRPGIEESRRAEHARSCRLWRGHSSAMEVHHLDLSRVWRHSGVAHLSVSRRGRPVREQVGPSAGAAPTRQARAARSPDAPVAALTAFARVLHLLLQEVRGGALAMCPWPARVQMIPRACLLFTLSA